ncbi:MAG TPA: Hsp20/alpha crystallin family protein [Vicinamibacterales bacterium]|jgi:HSP20 family protein
MRDFHRILLSSEVHELADEVGRLFEDLDRQVAAGQPASAGHCTPALDVLETEATVEVVVDLPGVVPESVRVLLKGGVLVIAGLKVSPYAGAGVRVGSFHLVERGFGRFARAVQLQGAFDGNRTRAVLQGGELRVVIPRLAERRGQEISVPIVTS